MLQHAVSARSVQLRTLQELKDASQTLITSMRRRCRAVIDALLGKFVSTNLEICENSVAKSP